MVHILYNSTTSSNNNNSTNTNINSDIGGTWGASGIREGTLDVEDHYVHLK